MSHLRRRFLALVLAGAAATGAAATDAVTNEQAQVRAGTAAAISFESEDKLHAAFEHLYSLEFAPAQQLFDEVIREEPQSATVCAFQASALLYEIMAHQGSLQSQLFVTTNEFLRHPRTPVDPALDRQFHLAAEMTITRAEKRLRANPNDADGLFALGLVYGSQANYLAGVKAEYLDGVRKGEKGYDLQKRLRALRPEIHDTGVVLGVREYVLGSLPAHTRFFLFFLGAGGNIQKGVEFLKDTAEHGEFLRTYAQVLVTVVHIRQKELERALPLLRQLQARYPRNPIFMLELAHLYQHTGRSREAAEMARLLLTEVTAHPHNPRVVGPEDALLLLGQLEAAAGQLERAIETLRRAAEVPGGNKKVTAEARLERGKVLDRLSRREQALAEYDKVLALGADLETVRAARAYRRRPYNPEKDR